VQVGHAPAGLAAGGAARSEESGASSGGGRAPGWGAGPGAFLELTFE